MASKAVSDSRSHGVNAPGRLLLRMFLAGALRCAGVCCALCWLVVWLAPPALPLPELQRRYLEAQDGPDFRNVSSMLAVRATELSRQLQDFPMILNGSAAIDVVISGGGFRGQYAGGVMSVLMPLVAEGRIRVQRYAGASIGAGAVAHFLSGADAEDFFRVPYGWRAVWSPRAFWRGGPIVREMLARVLPQNVSFPPGVFSVPIAVLSWPWKWAPFTFAETHWVDSFASPADVHAALDATSSIPFFTGHPFFKSWQGQAAMDSAFSGCNTPVFTDGQRPQLVVNLGALDYSLLYTFSPLDPQHEQLVMRGQDDIYALLRGRHAAPATHPIFLLQPEDPLLRRGVSGAAYRRFVLDLWAPVAVLCSLEAAAVAIAAILATALAVAAAVASGFADGVQVAAVAVAAILATVLVLRSWHEQDKRQQVHSEARGQVAAASGWRGILVLLTPSDVAAFGAP